MHFELHQVQERIKEHFAPFNPDAELKQSQSVDIDQYQAMAQELIHDFRHILERANYYPLSEEQLDLAFEDSSLIDVKTDIDFDDFAHMVCFYRGDRPHQMTVKQWYFRKKELKFDIFERVALLMTFQDADYFVQKGCKLDTLNFAPGKTYFFLYKDVPKFDLEFLFPNVQVSMTTKDRLFFGVPAIGGAVSVLIKVLPLLSTLAFLIIWYVMGTEGLALFDISEERIDSGALDLVAILSLCMLLGGFAFKQYSNYKNKVLQIQKHVTETLFFKNLATNSSVFQHIIDAAEEEECKEMILAYYHLLLHPEPLTPEALDDLIEQWMADKLDTLIDFDIAGPLGNLAKLEAPLSDVDGPLLRYDDAGRCHVLPLEQARRVIDHLWDNFFVYASPA